jgi:hypothetical protein
MTKYMKDQGLEAPEINEWFFCGRRNKRGKGKKDKLKGVKVWDF